MHWQQANYVDQHFRSIAVPNVIAAVADSDAHLKMQIGVGIDEACLSSLLIRHHITLTALVSIRSYNMGLTFPIVTRGSSHLQDC